MAQKTAMFKVDDRHYSELKAIAEQHGISLNRVLQVLHEAGWQKHLQDVEEEARNKESTG